MCILNRQSCTQNKHQGIHKKETSKINKVHPKTTTLKKVEENDDEESEDDDVFENLDDIRSSSKIFAEKLEPDHLLAGSSPAITNGFMAAFNYSAKNFFRIHCWPHLG